MKRFWDKVKKGLGCWEWQAYLRSDGYGWFNFKGKPALAHRVAWTLACGEIPEGQCVLHHCDNTRCCRPDHLFLGTQADNLADMGRKNRRPVGEAHWRAKLTRKDVSTIRRLYLLGRATQADLAKRYGIVPQAVSLIVNRKLWRHV